LAAPRDPVGVGSAHRNAEGRPCSDGQHDVEAHGRVEGASPSEGPARALQRRQEHRGPSWIRRAERRAGLSITVRIHILRHNFFTRLALRGTKTKTILYHVVP